MPRNRFSGLLELGGLVLLLFPAGVRSQTPPSRDLLGTSDPRTLDRTRDWRQVRLLVRETNGWPVSTASVTLAGTWVSRADGEGVVLVDCGPQIQFPVLLEIQARGFKSWRQTLLGRERDIEITLNRLEPKNLVAGKTVDLGELSKETQKQSQQLHKEAIEALERKDFANAEQLFLKALELTPSDVRIYNNLGVAFLKQQKLEQGARWFEKALELAPFETFASGHLGLIRWAQRRYDESYELLDRAVSDGFSLPSAHYLLGLLALKKRNCKQAIEQLSLVKPDRFRFRDLYLTIALSHLGKGGAAEKNFREFVKRNPAPLIRSLPVMRAPTRILSRFGSENPVNATTHH